MRTSPRARNWENFRARHRPKRGVNSNGQWQLGEAKWRWSKDARDQGGTANLPASLDGKTGDLHAEGSATRTRSAALLVRVRGLVVAAGTAGELDDQALAHEGRAVWAC
jgi:hypothetical protein